MPPPGAIDAWPIWYRLMDLTGAFVSAFGTVARFDSARRWPRVPAIDAAGADVSY